MRRTIIALLATAALATPAFAASNAPSNQQQPQAQYSQGQQQGRNGAPNQQASNQNQQASNQQTVAPRSLSRNAIREMQTALNNDGFNAGRTDGIWGPHTGDAVQKFDQSKGIQSKNGQLTENTLAQLDCCGR